MIAQTAAARLHHPEARLDIRPEVRIRDRYVQLAEHELDRSYRLAGLILGNASDAEDAVGDALERAWRDIDRLREPAQFRAWFDRIVVNACRDRLRRRRRVRFVELDGAMSAIAPDGFATVLASDDALRAMADLDGDERIVLILHFWADLTLESVADRLGWPVGTVKSRLNRALERRRQRLPATGSGSDER